MKSFTHNVIVMRGPNEMSAYEFLRSIIDDIKTFFLQKESLLIDDVLVEILVDKELFVGLFLHYFGQKKFVKNDVNLIEFEDFGLRFKVSVYFGDFGPILFPGLPFTVIVE